MLLHVATKVLHIFIDTQRTYRSENASSGRLQEVKSNGKSLTVRPKSGYGRLQGFFFIFTRGSNCKALTGKILVFWMGGRLREVVAYERWLHMEV